MVFYEELVLVLVCVSFNFLLPTLTKFVFVQFIYTAIMIDK